MRCDVPFTIHRYVASYDRVFAGVQNNKDDRLDDGTSSVPAGQTGSGNQGGPDDLVSGGFDVRAGYLRANHVDLAISGPGTGAGLA